jgi:hypothetical protein
VNAHDPMELLGEPLPEPLDPWKALADQARWLADYAERCAAVEPEILAPVGDHDALAELDARALAVRSLAAACRRHTYQALRDGGASVSDIAEAWGRTRQSVNQVLTAKKEKPEG